MAALSSPDPWQKNAAQRRRTLSQQTPFTVVRQASRSRLASSICNQVSARHTRRRRLSFRLSCLRVGSVRPEAKSTGPGTPMPIPHTSPECSLNSCSNNSLMRSRTASGPSVTSQDSWLLPDDSTGQVSAADADPARAKIGDEDVAGVRSEFQLARGTAAAGYAHAIFLEQSAVDQLVDPLGHHVAAQPGESGNAGLRPCCARSDDVQYRDDAVQMISIGAVARLHGDVVFPSRRVCAFTRRPWRPWSAIRS